MRLSLTSWSMPLCTLEECAAIGHALGIRFLDVSYFYRSALDRGRVLEDPETYADKVVRSAGSSPASFYHLFGQSVQDRNLADPSSAQQNLADFDKALRFCRAAGIPSIMVLPGVVNPGQSRRQAMDVSSAALAQLQSMAAKANVQLTVEPHVHSYLESPVQTLELLQKTPGLRLTLDYSHFLCLGYRQEEIDELAAYAAHVHLRQGRPGVLQSRLEMGTLNFNAILAVLRDANYSGFLALEYVHQDYMNTLFEDVLSETIKMRDLVNAWFSNSE